MIKYIKRIVIGLFPKYMSYYGRVKFGREDLKKSILNTTTISYEQKKNILNYWKPFLKNKKTKKTFDIRWYDVYNYTNRFGYKLERYIPDSFYYAIVDSFFSKEKESYVMDDKNLYDLYFSDVKQPKTILHKIDNTFLDAEYKIISKSKAIEACILNDKVIIKPSVMAAIGKGIGIWKNNNNSVDELRALLESSNNLIVQEFIIQNKFLSDLCDSCVNTMRLVTLLWNNEVHLTSSVLIMGGANAKTNHLHGGGIVCGILPSGQLQSMAFDGKLNCYEKHPNGQIFSEMTIPNFEKCVDMVKKLAPRLSGVSKLLNWDVTINENGEPILIEVNITFGGSVQIAGGPALGDLTEEVLNAIAQRNSKR